MSKTVLQNPFVFMESYVKTAISVRLKDQGSFEILETYKSDNMYACSKYLEIVKSVKVRNVFTRLRINNNKLQAYSHSDDTNCEKCNVLENTEHLLFHCKRECLLQERERFNSQILGIFPKYANKGTEAKIHLLLNIDTNNTDLTKIICHHISTMYNLRFGKVIR